MHVLDLVAQRARIAKIIAAHKYVAKSATVYDGPRELAVLKNVENHAAKTDVQLEPGMLMLFFQAQIDYAKFVQVYWMEMWKAKSGDGDSKQVEEEVAALLHPAVDVGLNTLRSRIVEIGQEQQKVLGSGSCGKAIVGLLREQGGSRAAFVTRISKLLEDQLKFRGGIPEEESGVAGTGVYRRMIAAALGGLFQDKPGQTRDEAAEGSSAAEEWTE